MYRTLVKNAVSFLKQEEGPTAVEYAVMLALIIVVCIASVSALGTPTVNSLGNPALHTAAT